MDDEEADMYSLEQKDRHKDHAKRQILSVQESYKVFVPLGVLLLTGLLALDIANAVGDFMAVYINVLVNVVGIGVECWVIRLLIRGNIRQRHLFAQLENGADENARVLRYVSDTDGVLRQADTVRIAETETAYIVLPQLQRYRHRLFTRYDFRNDFGRLTLPKAAYTAVEEGNGVRYVAADTQFVFAAAGKGVAVKADEIDGDTNKK